MTAITRIQIHPADIDNVRWQPATERRRRAKRWSILVKICKSYATQGLDYSAEIDAEEQTLIVRASGTPRATRCRRESKPKPYRDTGKPLTPKQAHARVADAENHLTCSRGAISRRISSGLCEPFGRRDSVRSREYRAEQQRIGHGLARIISRGGLVGKPTSQDYAELDELMGGKVTRLSKIGKNSREHTYRRYVMIHHAGAQQWCGYPDPVNTPPDPAAAMKRLLADFREARADLEFWRELESLAA